MGPRRRKRGTMESIWAATETAWRSRSLCRTAPPETFFPDQETEQALAYATERYCNHCPVRTTCLNAAIVNKDQGFFAGTNTAMRKALSSKRHRTKCPVCRSINLLPVEQYEVCVGCGASWRIEDRPAEKPSWRKPAEERTVENVPLGGSSCL